MKNKFIVILISCIGVFLSSCQSQELMKEDELSIVTATTNFAASGGDGVVTFDTNSEDLSFDVDVTWINMAFISDNEVSFFVDENVGAMKRSGNITLSAGTVQKVVSVVQNGALFDIEETSISMVPSGGENRLTFYTNMASAPEVTIEQDCEWLTAEADREGLTLVASLNYGHPRQAVVSVKVGWKDAIEVMVTQDVVSLFAEDMISVDREISISETVVSTTEYVSAVPEWTVETTDTPWLHVYKDEQGRILLDVIEQNKTASERFGVLSMLDADGNVIDVLNVAQKAYSLEFFAGEWTLCYGEGNMCRVTLSLDEEKDDCLLFEGLADGLAVSLAYEDSDEGAMLTLCCDGAAYDDFRIYATSDGTDLYEGDGAAWTLILDPSSLKTLTWKKNDALNTLDADISGIVVTDAEGNILASYASLESLSRETTPVDAPFAVSSEKVEMDALGETVTVMLKNMRFEPVVTVTDDSGWLTAYVQESQLILEAAFNYKGHRSASVTLNSGTETVVVSVTQPQIPVFTEKEVVLDADTYYDIVDVKVTEYVKYVATTWSVDSPCDWIQVKKNVTGDGFLVSVLSNPTGRRRTGSVDLRSRTGDVVASMPVYQSGYNKSTVRGTWRLYYGDGRHADIQIRRHEHDIRDGVAIEDCNRLEVRYLYTPNPLVFPYVTIYYQGVGRSNLQLYGGAATANWRYSAEGSVRYTGDTWLCPVSSGDCPEALVITSPEPCWDFIADIEEDETVFSIQKSAWLRDKDPEDKFTGWGYCSNNANAVAPAREIFWQKSGYAIWDRMADVDRLVKLSTPSESELSTTW